MINPPCIECGMPSRLVYGDDVYPHRKDLYHKAFYVCDPCEAYVGCHPNSEDAMGYPAGKETRNARSYVHRIFDPMWKTATDHYPADANKKRVRRLARTRCYEFLAHEMGMTKDECHVGMFDVDQCRQAYAILKKVDYPHIRNWAKARRQAA